MSLSIELKLLRLRQCRKLDKQAQLGSSKKKILREGVVGVYKMLSFDQKQMEWKRIRGREDCEEGKREKNTCWAMKRGAQGAAIVRAACGRRKVSMCL